MILDASVAIALRSAEDAHSERAAEIVADTPILTMHPVTLAEVLVAPARVGAAAEARALLVDELGLSVWVPDEEEPERVAILRARTRVSLPDCYPLMLAIETGEPLATFDEALQRAALELDVAVV